MPEMLFQPLDPASSPIENPLGIVPLNTNNATVMMGNFDMRIVFSELVAEGVANNPKVLMRANLSLSPTFLKSLYQAIGSTMEIYEKQNGEIKWPPQPLKTA